MPDRKTPSETPSTSPPPAEADRRAERLAQALRANLKRRKDQARGRDATPPRAAGEAADEP